MTSTLSSYDVEIINSNLYKDFLAEREEILKNKWFMSEKEGKDVGFERALLDWVTKHRPKWRNNKKLS